MDDGAVATVIAAVLTIGGGFWQSRRTSHRDRDRIEQDLRILTALPGDSEGKSALRTSIDQRVLGLLGGSAERRDVGGVTIALIFLIVCALTVWQGYSGGSWWRLLWVAAAITGSIGLYGLVESWKKVARDASGRRVSR
ncbi:hypothetical protein ACFP63_08735 [Oerskovia jenensis]|uniref:Uncharacterized protein n=1 Tax=Oerskovia jenensis TaxID=162169 RepID=A0ABS2LJ50_9CELL|nr:hypothetical protein [Oerskovia jenensis]MBM7480138.1 hypothetical protein [Oerskovia jenensis]